ncbi:MAG TPA: hypothetical protein VMH79_09930 [Thermoanaerobaculia bacterium]|nr:hypothetical protein [Thermoanaerobaculia bacterium]
MSVERIQILHEDYIRLTERFKASWTFHQFLRGVQKTFFAAEPTYSLDFGKLYDDVRAVAGAIDTTSPEKVAPRLRELSDRLDAFGRRLREADRLVSPSYVRRFFEKVRPQDEKIAFHLLRFYFSQPDADEDVVDKVDFLATVAAAGQRAADADSPRPRPDLQRFFEAVTAASVWPRLDGTAAPPIVRAFDDLAGEMARAQEFEDLVTARLLNNVRQLKRRVATGLANPEVLVAVARCNLRTRSVFHRLYETEERRLEEATDRIGELEKELARGGLEAPSTEEFRRFRESRERWERQSKDGSVRAVQVVELKEAIGAVLGRFELAGLAAEDIDEALGLVEEVESEGAEDAFWKPYLDRLLGAVEHYDDGTGPVRPGIAGLENLRLEPWELKAARRTVANGGEPTSERDRTLLRAVALRLKADEEVETLRAAAGLPPSPETLRAARATLGRAAMLDAALSAVVDEAEAVSSSEEIRCWTRTRFRLLRSTADLWLMQDSPRADRRESRP